MLLRRSTSSSQVDATAAGNGHQGIGFSGFAVCFQWLQMHADERADDLKVAQLLRADIQQQVATPNVVQAVPTLDGVLHGSGKFAVRAAKLFQQHVAEPNVRLADIHRVHQLLNVVIHCTASVCEIFVPRTRCSMRYSFNKAGYCAPARGCDNKEAANALDSKFRAARLRELCICGCRGAFA
jgi:hypothetical protein